MAIGEEGRPQGVGVWGIRAIGVKVGEGREERPVPPIMAIGTGSDGGLVGLWRWGKGSLACVCGGEVVHLAYGFCGE